MTQEYRFPWHRPQRPDFLRLKWRDIRCLYAGDNALTAQDMARVEREPMIRTIFGYAHYHGAGDCAVMARGKYTPVGRELADWAEYYPLWVTSGTVSLIKEGIERTIGPNSRYTCHICPHKCGK